MANLENPKDDLKKKGEVYAGYIIHGVPKARCKPFDIPPEDASANMLAAWSGKSIWDMWGAGLIHQYFIMQWALQKGPNDLKAVVRYMLRVGQLPKSPTDTGVCFRPPLRPPQKQPHALRRTKAWRTCRCVLHPSTSHNGTNTAARLTLPPPSPTHQAHMQTSGTGHEK